MGSSSIQSQLWGRYPQDWSYIQEVTGLAGYEYVLQHLDVYASERNQTGTRSAADRPAGNSPAKNPTTENTKADSLLDVGCGSGLFASLAAQKGFTVTGIDATLPLIEEAKKRAPGIRFLTGEMEELPFDDQSFSIVTGFNSFQYAASVANALAEARRILKAGGQLAAMIWGNKEDCEAATYLKAVGSLLPPPPPGAGGPFALTENHLLETTLEAVGFTVTHNADIQTIWDYPDLSTAMKGLLSAGPAVKAIQHSGYDKVYGTIAAAVKPYAQPNGHIAFHNKFRIVLAMR